MLFDVFDSVMENVVPLVTRLISLAVTFLLILPYRVLHQEKEDLTKQLMQLQTKYENILNQFEKNDAVKSNQAAEKLKVETLDMGNFFSNGDTPKKTGICPLLRVK